MSPTVILWSIDYTRAVSVPALAVLPARLVFPSKSVASAFPLICSSLLEDLSHKHPYTELGLIGFRMLWETLINFSRGAMDMV